MNKLEHFINKEYLNPDLFSEEYRINNPFSHIVLKNFIKKDILEKVLSEYPDLSQIPSRIQYNNQKEIKFASQGYSDLSESATTLINFLNCDVFLKYLQSLTGINETIISDSYLSGGGYHEIKTGGVLKVHADFNKHPQLNLDRRVNLIIYLNKDWDRKWGGGLELYKNDNLENPKVKVVPDFNTCVIFNTTSFTLHGHPEKLSCPEDRSRKSIALYYFSTGRPSEEIGDQHSTLFKEVKGEKFRVSSLSKLKNVAKDFIPPIVLKLLNR